MKKFFKKAHLWMSLPCGIFISILCLTGVFLVFDGELLLLLNHDNYYVDEVKDEALPFEKLIPMVRETFPQWEMEGVFLYGDPKRAYQFDFQTAKNESVQVNPYTGEIVSVIFPGYDGWSGSEFFFDAVQKLHTRLLLSANRGEFAWGRFITGLATLIFFFIIVTGIIIWAPKKAKNIKERLKVSVNKGGFRFWYDLHLAGGILAAIFLLLMVLTALNFSFNWYHNGLFALFGGGDEQPQVQQPVQQQGPSADNVEDLPKIGKSLDMLYQQLRRDYPDATDIGFKFGGSGFVSENNRRINTNISFDPQTGEIRDIELFKNWAKDEKLTWIIELLHFGTWAGAFSKTIYLLACIIGAILPITGYYFYFRKKMRKKN